MIRLRTTGAALAIFLATTGLALAQGYNAGPAYTGGAPTYGQPMPQQYGVPQQPYGWQSAPPTDAHSSGTADRAYDNGQKSN
jgi:hypothetical protein